MYILQHRKCQLTVGSMKNIVAVGYVEDVYSITVHGILLGDDNYHVAVEFTFVEGAPLPILNEDISATLVVLVIGSFVAWPKSLVLFDDMMIIKLSSSLFCLMPIHFIDTLILL